MKPGTVFICIGPLGIPQIARVSEAGSWIGLYGFSKGRKIRAATHDVCQVLNDGDTIEISATKTMIVKNGKLIEKAGGRVAT